MSEEAIVRDFLISNPGYYKTGSKKISLRTGVRNIDLIKRVRREVEDSRTRLSASPEITPELIEAVKKALAEEGGHPLVEKSTGLFPLKQKRDQDIYNTPGTHLVMGCNHIPFHNKVLHDGIREMMMDLGSKMVGFHIIGDFLDINSLSSHDKGKFTAVKGLTLNSEYFDGNDELDMFEQALPDSVVNKSFIYGNHEDRVNRYNADMQNAKAPAQMPHDALSLRFRGYSVHEKWSQDLIKVGGIELFHGIYFNIHNAKKHLDTFGKNCMYVHTHRSQMYREGAFAAYNIGACADFSSRAFGYATRAMKQSWANGFALIDVDEYGVGHVTQIDVRNSKFFYNGKKY